MINLSYADIVSSLALFAAIIALLWNIIRDLILDKISVKIHVLFGEAGNIEYSSTALFAAAGSLKPDHKFDNPKILVKIINTGRRSIVISGVGGKLKNGEMFSMTIKGLPKMIEPYEQFADILEIKDSFMDIVRNNEIKQLWAYDTNDKKWLLSSKGLKRLKETAAYINSSQNL